MPDRVEVDTSESDEGSRQADREMVRNAKNERYYRGEAESMAGRLLLSKNERDADRRYADDSHKRMQAAAEEGASYRRGAQRTRELGAELGKAMSSSKKRASSKKR